MGSKKIKRLVRTQEQYNARLRKINKIVDAHLWRNKPAKECMEEIVKIVYSNGV